MPLNDVKGLLKAAFVGLITAFATALAILPLFWFELIPMPQPPSQAFAETLLGPVPETIGFLFHLAYVTVVAGGFLVAVEPRPALWAVGVWSLGLWGIAMVSFFPIIGWGVAGATVTSSVALGALGPHLLFGAILWATARLVFRPGAHGTGERARGAGCGKVSP
jgi:hypothetical protein